MSKTGLKFYFQRCYLNLRVALKSVKIIVKNVPLDNFCFVNFYLFREDESNVFSTVYFTPVACFLLFNCGDYLGRILASNIRFLVLFYYWTEKIHRPGQGSI